MRESLAENIKSLQKLYSGYSLRDVLEALFAINLLPNNITAPIQHNFQYEAIRGMSKDSFQNTSKITNYDDFVLFCTELSRLTPSFPMLEDYSPPIDFGNSKYYYNREIYSILWGVDGSTYDQISEFELIYVGNEKKYLERTGVSPSDELREILQLQDRIVINLAYNFKELEEYMEPGHFEVPGENFWRDIRSYFYTDFNYEFPLLVKNYTSDLDQLSKGRFEEERFMQDIQLGSTLNSLFIKSGDSILPILPRYGIETVTRRWKSEFSKHHLDPKFWEPLNDPRKDLTVHLSLYERDHFGENKSQYTVMLLGEDGMPDRDNYLSSLTFSENKIVATLVAKPSDKAEDFETELPQIIEKANNALSKFNSETPKFFLPLKSQILEMQAGRKDNFKIEIIVVLPVFFSGPQRIKLPHTDGVTYFFLEDFLGVVDSCERESELLEFIEYTSSEKFFHTGMLDLFGSYKDSLGVLVAGASEPNVAFITPSWGPSFRHGALTKFWELYPGVDILDDPRGWNIKQETPTRIRLIKKSIFHSLIYSKYGNTHLIQSSPFTHQEYEVAAVSNLLMESLEDTLSRVSDQFSALPAVKYSDKIEVHYFPADLITDETFSHLKHLIPNDQWKLDSGRYSQIGLGVRLVFDHAKLANILQNSKDNQLDLELAKAVVVAIDELEHNQPALDSCLKSIDNLAGKPRFTQVAVKKEASHPPHSTLVRPSDTDLKKARKLTAFATKSANLKPGKYRGEPAKIATNTIIETLRTNIEKQLADYSYEKSIAVLIGYVDSEIANYRYKHLGLIASQKHDVDYRRDHYLAVAKKEFLVNHKANRYLLEKFISMKPNGEKMLHKSETSLLMAMSDEIVGAYSASDSLHYDMYQPYIEIDSDFQIGVTHSKAVLKNQERYNRKQSRIALGRIGKKSDRIGSPDIISFAEKVDTAFENDLGFKLTHLLACHQILSLYSEYTDKDDQTNYSAPEGEVIAACKENIKGINEEQIRRVLNFMTLEPSKLKYILGDPNPPKDLPVWESIKRPYRYSIRPLVRIGSDIIWGPYAVNLSMGLWNRVIVATELPTNLEGGEISDAIRVEHAAIDLLLEKKCIEIGKRFTEYAKNIKPKHVNMPKVYGDYDCLMYLPEINMFLNIEAKNLNSPSVSKDVKTQIERVFLDEKSYVSKVENRGTYLEEHFQDFANHFGVEINEQPVVRSLFITTNCPFWMEYPFKETQVKFLRIDFLDNYLKSLLKNRSDYGRRADS